MRILILGGGSVGGKLALDMKDPFVLIEADPSRVWELKEFLKDKTIDSHHLLPYFWPCYLRKSFLLSSLVFLPAHLSQEACA